ncbi:ABC transporter permease [Microbulbifer sp. TRSA002]|uniref:ABC transporter permease n=1 Tax=Microbulbifer sp. TRSA002 TaxID=3243382 RepID=UPI004039B0C4
MLELKPMLSALWRNKISALLIALQLGLTLAIVSNTAIIIQDRIEKINRPTGIEVEDLITVGFMAIPQDYDTNGAIKADLSLLRDLPYVVNASITNQIPISGSGSASRYYNNPNQEVGGETSNYYQVDPQFINTLNLNLIAGRNFTEAEMQIGDQSIPSTTATTIITKQLAEKLYPDQDPIGKPIFQGGSSEPMEIIGVVEQHLGAWVSWSNSGNVMFFPVIKERRFAKYMVRTEPGKRDEVMQTLEDKLSERDPQRVISVNTLSKYVDRSYAIDNTMVKVLSIVAAMLSFIVALGIVGLTIFWINQRAKQIGVRRALGATRTNISRYFLLENGIISGLGITVGCAAALIANQYMVRDYSQPTLTIVPLVVCALLVLLISLTAALAPALRAANISPATATRNI